MGTYDALEASIRSTRQFLSRVRPADMTKATPCSEWDVHGVLNHVLGTLGLGTALLSQTPPEVMMAPGGQPESDMVGTDPLAAYDRGAQRLLDAAKVPGVFEGTRPTPLGDMPAQGLAGFTILDITMHGWDLARGAGIDATLEPELAQHVLDFAHSFVGPELRQKEIAAAIALNGNASVTDRLAAYLGRQP